MRSLPQNFADRRVTVIGLGYVGLTLAVAMADSGFEVMGVEVRQDVIDMLVLGYCRQSPETLRPQDPRGPRPTAAASGIGPYD